MRILGVDPGSLTTGYALIEKRRRGWAHLENGIISPKRTLPVKDRLFEIHSALSKIIEKYKPDTLALERIFLSKNPQTAIVLGEARGMALLACAEHKLVLAEYTPLSVKQAVVGFGRASKAQVQEMMKRHFALPEIACEDAADALAIALTHGIQSESAARTPSRPPLILRGGGKTSWRDWRPS